jgi:hypothetical protein
MSSMSSVVDQLVSELAERRRTARSRQAGYVALARAIVADDQPELLVVPAFERQPTAIGQATGAAA